MKEQKFQVARGTLHNSKDGRKIADVPAFSLSKLGHTAQATIHVHGDVAAYVIEQTTLELRFDYQGVPCYVIGTFDDGNLGSARGGQFSGDFKSGAR